MKKELISQKLLQLQSRDIVRKWFKIIHEKDLSIKRAMEINSAAKQSSEYFKNAKLSNFIVRPLLTFYGVNALSRAIILLLKINGGENTLKNGHGLSIIGWNNILFREDLQNSLPNLGALTITTCKGRFLELIEAINNTTTIHINSETVDWIVPYDPLNSNISLTLNDLLSRIPDFENELENIDIKANYSNISGLTNNNEKGFWCQANKNRVIEEELTNLGYIIKDKPDNVEISCSEEILCKNAPLFLHKYIDKSFGYIPILFISKSINGINSFSEISICYMMGFFLGMLARYYPTQWNALINGASGDKFWPILNKAQHYVEDVFPELIAELIDYKVNKRERKQL